MGIDVYLIWDKQTETEKERQYTGFIIQGEVGYLRESYHGAPYATKILITENWEKQPDNGFVIKNEKLWSRLPFVLTTSIIRNKLIYNNDLSSVATLRHIQSFIDFIRLHERLEKENKNPRIVISY